MDSMEGVRKAAILLISLGSETSSKIMKLLPENLIKKLTYAIANIEAVDSDEQSQVLNEVVNTIHAHKYVLDGGIDYAKNLLMQAVGPQKAKEILDVLKQIQLKERPFDIVRRADVKQLVNLLSDEHPQTVALIFCYLQSNKAAEVLSNFPPEKQADIAERIGTISSASPAIVKQVEGVIETKFSSYVENDNENIGGVKTLVDILNSVSRSTEKHILGDLEKRQPELASEVKASLFTFDDIILLDPRDVQKVLRGVENDVLVLALKGANDQIKEFVFSNLSTRAVENIKEEIEFLGPTRLSNIEEAQQKIVGVIRRLDEAGEIIIQRGGQDEVVS
ncbi:MAG: flagellar motor switch protein FliG [Liquorilactobacillus nagelii]